MLTAGPYQVGRPEAEAGAATAEVGSKARGEVSEAVKGQVRPELPANQSAAGLRGGNSNLCGGIHPCVHLWQALA